MLEFVGASSVALACVGSFKFKFLTRDFWIYTIGTWLITLAVSLVAGLIYGATGSETLFMGLIIIGCIGLFVLNIAYIFVTIRRLHDMGYSGWWYLAVLVAVGVQPNHTACKLTDRKVP